MSEERLRDLVHQWSGNRGIVHGILQAHRDAGHKVPTDLWRMGLWSWMDDVFGSAMGWTP